MMSRLVLFFLFCYSLLAIPVELDLRLSGEVELLKKIITKENLYTFNCKDVRDKLRLNSIVINDLSLCQKMLKGAGMFESEVSKTIEKRDNKYLVHININSGPVFLVKKVRVITVEGKEIKLDTSDIVGKRVNFDKLVDLEGALKTRFGKRGYPFESVTKKNVTVLHKTRTVNVLFVVDLGEKSSFGNVIVKGSDKVSPEFILKHVPWSEGDIFDIDLLSVLKERLLALNLFNQVVIKIFKDGKGKAGVKIRVSEAKPRIFEVGVKYSTENNTFYSRKISRKLTGASVTGSWTHFNVFGNGESLRFRVEGSPFYSSSALKIRSSNPSDLAKKDALDLPKEGEGTIEHDTPKGDGETNKKEGNTDSKGYRQIIKVSPDSLIAVRFKRPKFYKNSDMLLETMRYNTWNIKYAKRSSEFEVDVNTVLNDHIFTSLGVSSENYTLREFFENDDGETCDIRDYYRFLSFGCKFIYNWMDKKYDPTSGGILEAYISPKISHSSSLIHTHIKYTQMVNVNVAVLALWCSYDCMFASKDRRIPADKLLYSGGQNSIRAYAKNYACKFVGSYPQGGRSCVEFGAELIKHINKDWGACLFFEGAVVSKYRMPRHVKPFYGIGVGVRYYTTFAPVSLDIAIPTRRRKGIDAAFQILIAVGKNI